MRNVAICGEGFKNLMSQAGTIETIEIEGVPVHCGLVQTSDIHFDRNAPDNEHKVLVKIRAFSCNYRDKSLILQMATRGQANSFYVVGSEFVGEVVDLGPAVPDLQPGDRVIGNGSYPKADVEGLMGGLPTNHGSKEYQAFHWAKLMKIPPAMPDEIAAVFPIGAQTTYSMIRKLTLQPGENVLVTAAKSNTSLFAINALKNWPVNVYATTTSLRFEDELRQMGVKRLVQIDPQQATFVENETLKQIAAEIGGFDAVIDPFFDLHLGKVVPVMASGGRYVTCGHHDQYSDFIGKDFGHPRWEVGPAMTAAILGNLHFIGNCIGQTDDLRRAIDDYAAGKLHVGLDSTFSQGQVGAFFARTYNDPARFGKVVYKYE
ncbi:MAG: zinc-binding alcohol dehydrogenase family protein [Anaerolineae bacterium]|nr:zinc-binding alcohol dehydrogenase family protein [Anaerolineae bacterium]